VKIRRVPDDIAVTERPVQGNRVPHPVRRIRPQHLSSPIAFVRSFKSQRSTNPGMTASNNSVFMGLSSAARQAVRRPVQPYPFDSRIDRGSQKKPDPLHAARDRADRCRIHVLAGSQKVNATQDVMRPHRRQIPPDLISSGVRQPVPDKRALALSRRIASFEFEDNPTSVCDSLRKVARGRNPVAACPIRYDQDRRFPRSRSGDE